MGSTQPPACSPVPTGKSRHSLVLRSSGLPHPPAPPAIIGRREAGSSELHPGKCSPVFTWWTVLGGEPGLYTQSGPCLPSGFAHPSPSDGQTGHLSG